MTDRERPEFAKALAVLSQAHNESVNELRAEAYWLALNDIPLVDFQRACFRAMRELRFFPKPVELRDLVFGSVQDAIESAWTSWRNAARRLGGTTSVAFSDAALAETLKQIFGGWPEACACELSPEMWSAKRKEFERVYRLMREKSWSAPHMLAGSHERNNASLREWSRFTPHGIIDGDRARAVEPAEFEKFLVMGDLPLLTD